MARSASAGVVRRPDRAPQRGNPPEWIARRPFAVFCCFLQREFRHRLLLVPDTGHTIVICTMVKAIFNEKSVIRIEGEVRSLLAPASPPSPLPLQRFFRDPTS